MRWQRSTARLAAAFLTAFVGVNAQQRASDPGAAPDAAGGDGASVGLASFAAFDRNTDGAVTRAEMKETLDKWFASAGSAGGSAAEADLASAVQLPQPRLPFDSHVQAMLAALPDYAAAKPKQPRKVLVLNKTSGFIHTPIPLTA